MPFYIVVDDKSQEHFVEAFAGPLALNQVPGAESYRIAQQFEINKHLGKECPDCKGKGVDPSDGEVCATCNGSGLIPKDDWHPAENTVPPNFS
jgi:hypothetical protein